MSVADKLGFGPRRVVTMRPGGGALVEVTPPSLLGLPTQRVELTPDQYRRYESWLAGQVLIQQALPDLTPALRELIMTGIGPEDFKHIAGAETDD